MLSKEEMSRHQGYRHLPWQAILEDRLLYLLGLDTHAGEEEVTNLLRRHRFSNCTFYWDDLNPLFQLSTKHMGYCIVEFPDTLTRDRHLQRLSHMSYMATSTSTCNTQSLEINLNQRIPNRCHTSLFSYPHILVTNPNSKSLRHSTIPGIRSDRAQGAQYVPRFELHVAQGLRSFSL